MNLPIKTSKISKKNKKSKRDLDFIEQKVKFYFEKENKEFYKKIKIKEIVVTIILILILISLFLLIFQPDLTKLKKLTGFVITQQEETYQDTLNLQFNTSTEYEWRPKHYGQLTSVKVSGTLLLGKGGLVKIYLKDKLILDSSQLEKEQRAKESRRIKITGLAVEELNESKTLESSQASEANLNETELLQPEVVTYEIDFSKICIETCELKALNLIDRSYLLRIEIENASLHLDTIIYSILPIEENVTNQAPKLIKEIPDQEILINSSKTLNLSDYFLDPDGDILSFAYKVLENENLTSIEINENILTITSFDVFGSQTVVIYASDGNLTTESNHFFVNITEITNITNNPPLLIKNISDITIFKNQNYTLNLNEYFIDPDKDILTFNSTQPQNITVLIQDSLATLIPETNFTGTREIIFYANDGNLITESNVVNIHVVENITKCSFSVPRKDNKRLPEGWYIREADLSNEEELNENVLKIIFLGSDEFHENALFYNLSASFEIKDNPEIKSNAFDIEKGAYRIVFYTKPDMILRDRAENGFSIIFDVFDKNGRELETYPPLVWNNTEIWEIDPTQKGKRNVTFEDFSVWKKITIELEFPENSDKVVFAFLPLGFEDYSGQVTICNFSIQSLHKK